jgi:hypothetical protein
VTDEDDVVARHIVGSGKYLGVGVGDFFLEGGGMAKESADESWKPYWLCNMDSAAA